MRLSTIAFALSASSVLAAPTEPLYTIELAPGETRQVTETEKWALKAVCVGATRYAKCTS